MFIKENKERIFIRIAKKVSGCEVMISPLPLHRNQYVKTMKNTLTMLINCRHCWVLDGQGNPDSEIHHFLRRLS